MLLGNLVRGGHPLGRLKALHDLRAQSDEMFDDLECALVDAARSMNPPATWEDIGNALGVNKSNALRKFSPKNSS